ncbi:MAG: biotin--[acetyl-CoA-carboxylase] ligase, partial [Actinobacteria bacterium]|nr:biotin--[acetyl-CoA-carboxylase] ligase [Actinomycetota bacterium]NIV58605.1 biotin--[acetyl-CoA-carboxylase] ligase [Actinomycetota bacterium]NIX53401.1 biotin--[acetyl-CoA-carboxylase] ligase [Actinomycetota bacterium]
MTTSTLDGERLGRLLAEEPFVSRIHLRASVDSTSDELRRLADEGAEPGTVVIAEQQLAGRGRRGRSWHSPPGLGL